MSKIKTKKKHLRKSRLQKPLIIFITALFLVTGGYSYPYLFPKTPTLPTPSLKDLAATHDMRLGMLTNPRRLGSDPYRHILTSQFSFITSDGEIHWNKFRPTPTEYDYRDMDYLVNFGKENNLPMQAHHLVWNEEDSLPDWLKDGKYSREQLMEIMRTHIETTVGHYKDRISEWTVVNEAFTRQRQTYGLNDWWGDHLGSSTDYIDEAFKWARQADPNATLILNDFLNETENDISNAMYDYLKTAKANAVPIDAIGMQMHIDALKPPKKADIIKNMQRFKDLGYPVYITEFNIHAETFVGSAEAKSELEAKITADVVRACVESQSCVSFTVFGQTDRVALRQWITFHKTPSHLFNPKYQPKQSFYAFHRSLLEP